MGMPGGGAVERFGGGAVAAGGNDGPEAAGAMKFVGPRADFRPIGDQLGPSAASGSSAARNRSSRWWAGPAPALGLVEDQHLVGLGRKSIWLARVHRVAVLLGSKFPRGKGKVGVQP